MQSQPTTSVQLPSLFDLLAPAASPGGSGQSIFDTLLQPPTAPSAPSAPTPSGDARPTAARNDSQSKRPDNDSLSPTTRPAESSTPTDSAPPQPAPRNTESTSPTTGQPPGGDSKAPEKTEPTAQDNVTAQSLAGLAAVQPATAAAPESAPEEAGNAAAGAAAIAKAKASAGSQTADALPGGDAAAVQATTDQAADAKQDSAAEKQAVTPTKLADGTNATAKAAAEKASAPATDKPTAEPTAAATDSILPAADGKTTDNPSSDRHSDRPQADPNPLVQQAAVDPAAQPVATNTPVAAPVAAILPVPAANADQPVTSSASSPGTAPLGAASGPRSRLPTDALAPGPRTATRTAPTETDTARLLSRVAKAFSAAQDRDGEVRLRLSPPELGSLRLEVRVQDGAVVAHVQTETDSARTAIIDNLPALRDRLADQGMRIERFDVDLMQRQPGGSPDQPGGRQPDMPAPMRLAPPPKPRSDSAGSTSTPVTVSGPASGLNIII